MIYVLIFLSMLFIGIGYLVTEKNAKYLLSGYNTMSEEERKNTDIHSYIPFFRKFHVFLGISLLIFGIALYYFFDPDWSGIFMGTYPLLAYIFFIWKGKKFYYHPNKKQNRKNIFSMVVMILVFIGISGMFIYSLQDNKIEFRNNGLEIKGDYGIHLNINNIKSIELVQQLPEISTKTNGFALEKVKKGYFKTKSGEKILLFLNTIDPPFIFITTNDHQKIYYSSKEKSNQIIFNELKNYTHK